ncbi:MAG: serine/threonine-protein kinase, partial [Pirellulaceae bacterium]|nr:serine/threonine-protein kinase [Pirellulaceae bacterium]
PLAEGRRSSRPSEEQLPRNFGDYELLEKIAQGGMGVVYKARQNSLNRIVAIKMILMGQTANEDDVRRFYNEAEAAAQLDHPGIVPVFDVGCCEGQHYFSMGFVEGESFAELLQRKPLPPRAAASYLAKIAESVQAAHDQGIIHRDLKPSNVLLDAEREPRVTDFGLAKRLESDSELTAAGTVIGTPGYMPPEQAGGNLDLIGVHSDVYSLGGVLYAALSGRAPFESDNQMDTLISVLQETPQSLRQQNKSIPVDLEIICLKCLEKEPSLRYASAQEMADDLHLFLSGEPILAKNDLYRRLRKWSIKEPTLVAHLAAITAMMSLVLFIYLLIRLGLPIGGSDAPFTYLWRNELILASWAVASLGLQKARNHFPSSASMLSLFWAMLDPAILTLLISVNDHPRELLYSLFLLLVVTTGFFRRVDLVAVTTVTSLFGYLLLQWSGDAAHVYEHRSHIAIFASAIIVTGLMQGFQVLRLKRISAKMNS